MKSIEQKAKAYDEAIKKLREFYRDYDTVSNLIDVKEELANLFPEIRESEDEKIRNEIIEFMRHQIDRFGDTPNVQKKYEYWIAWFEKQSEQILANYAKTCKDEQKPTNNIEPKFKVGDKVCAISNRFECTIESIDESTYYGDTTNFDIKDQDKWKLIEQKPTERAEPKFKVGDTMRTLQEVTNGYTDGMPVVVSIDEKYYHCTNELIAIKDQEDYEFPPINVKQKPTDNVEPKFKVGDWITHNTANFIFKIINVGSNGYEVVNRENYKKTISFDNEDNYHLLAIPKSRIVSSTWGEEDEKMRNNLIRLLIRLSANTQTNSTTPNYSYPNEIDWLKSLKPQKQWKPSDEQIKAFEHFVRSIGESGYASPYENNTKLLYSLLNDLKNLTE